MTADIKRSKAVGARGRPTASEATDVRFTMSLPSETCTLIADHRVFAAKLVEHLASALRRSRRSGKPYGFTVSVDPFGYPRVTKPSGIVDPPADLPAVPAQVRPPELFKQDDMLSAEQFAELIGTSPVTVYERRRKNQLLGLAGAKRGFRFPTWQLDRDGKPFAALPALFDRLDSNSWTVYHFLLGHHPELDGLTGLEALRRDQTRRVLDIASSQCGRRDGGKAAESGSGRPVSLLAPASRRVRPEKSSDETR